jgi:peptide/nickel transport system substrate-binding protein
MTGRRFGICRWRTTFHLIAAMVLMTTAEPGFAQSKPPLIIGIPRDLTTLDPDRVSAGSDDNLFANVFEGLYGTDVDGNAVPVLAESVMISEDGLIYDFKLRQGVTFHNGDPFTAEDVRYSWQHGIDPEIRNPRAVVVLNNISDIEIVDPDHVRMKLKVADAATLANMQGTFYILSKKYMTEGAGRDEATRKPIGTGPFKFVDRRINEYLKLTANDNYWGQVPQVGDVTMRVVPDPQSRFALVQTGEADIVSFVPAFTASREGSAKDYKIIRGPGLVNVFMEINTRGNNPDLRKPQVRRAFNMAIDKAALFKAITLGFATLQDGASCGPAVFGCDPPPPGYKYDVKGARKLLEEAKFDFSRAIRIVAPATAGGTVPQSRETAEAIAYSLQQIGVKTDLVIKEYAAWLAEDQQASQPKNPEDDVVMSVVPDYNINPGARLRRAIMTDGIFSWFSDQDLDKTIVTLDTIQSPQQRLEYAREMWRKIHELAPSISLWSFDAVYAARNKIKWKPAFGSNYLVISNVVEN